MRPRERKKMSSLRPKRQKPNMRVLDVEQGSEAWKQARAGVITGSELHRIMGPAPARRDYAYELIANTVAPIEEKFVNKNMERGIEMESSAIDAYERATGSKTERVGFCLHDKFDWFGMSPDRLVREEDVYTEAVEAKNPMSKNHLKNWDSNEVPPEYWYQVLAYFLVCDTVQKVRFVSFDSRFYIEKMRLKIITVNRADVAEELGEVMEKLVQFRAEWEKLSERLLF